MAQAESILTLAYDFLLYLIPALSKLPRDHKFNLGDRIQNVEHPTGRCIKNLAHHILGMKSPYPEGVKWNSEGQRPG